MINNYRELYNHMNFKRILLMNLKPLVSCINPYLFFNNMKMKKEVYYQCMIN